MRCHHFFRPLQRHPKNCSYAFAKMNKDNVLKHIYVKLSIKKIKKHETIREILIITVPYNNTIIRKKRKEVKTIIDNYLKFLSQHNGTIFWFFLEVFWKLSHRYWFGFTIVSLTVNSFFFFTNRLFLSTCRVEKSLIRNSTIPLIFSLDTRPCY